MEKYTLKPDVMIRDDREETLVFKAHEGRLFEVNATAERVLRALEETRSVEELVAHLDEEYTIASPADRRMVERTLAEVEELGLVEKT